MANSDPRSPATWRRLAPDAVARFDAELEPYLRRHPEGRKPSAMIAALRIGQSIFGHLSPEVMELASDRLGTSPERAEEVATFYSMLERHPRGRHLVEVCTNVSCCLSGAEGVVRALRTKLGVEVGETTADGRVTLREVECLGSCGTGPAALVDEEMVERITAERLERIVEDLS